MTSDKSIHHPSDHQSYNKTPRRGDRYERERAARILAIQNLFEADFHKIPVERVLKSQLENRKNMNQAPVQFDRPLLIYLINTYSGNTHSIQSVLEESILESWSTDSMDGLLIALLKIAITEIVYPSKEKPQAVIISEYVSIATGFLDDKEIAYVNKVLDQIAKKTLGS